MSLIPQRPGAPGSDTKAQTLSTSASSSSSSSSSSAAAALSPRALSCTMHALLDCKSSSQEPPRKLLLTLDALCSLGASPSFACSSEFQAARPLVQHERVYAAAASTAPPTLAQSAAAKLGGPAQPGPARLSATSTPSTLSTSLPAGGGATPFLATPITASSSSSAADRPEVHAWRCVDGVDDASLNKCLSFEFVKRGYMFVSLPPAGTPSTGGGKGVSAVEAQPTSHTASAPSAAGPSAAGNRMRAAAAASAVAASAARSDKPPSPIEVSVYQVFKLGRPGDLSSARPLGGRIGQRWLCELHCVSPSQDTLFADERRLVEFAHSLSPLAEFFKYDQTAQLSALLHDSGS